jgi:protein RecA
MFVVDLLCPENPFTTPVKAGKWHLSPRLSRRMKGIENAGRAQVRCIRVAAEDSLYVTHDYVVTHNSSLALIGIAQAQRADPKAMQGWIDMEQTYDSTWATKLGVDTSRLYLARPNNAEDVADIMKTMITSGLMNKVTLDSVGGMVSKADMENNAEDVTVGKVPKVVTRMVQIGAVECRRHGVDVGIINQVRAAIGNNGPRAASTTRGGGFALGHSTSHRMKIRRTGEKLVIGKGDSQIQVGTQIAIHVEKNKVARANRTAEVFLITHPSEEYGPIGIDRASEAYQLGILLDLFDRSGSHITFGDGAKTNGKPAAIQHIREHPSIVTRIRRMALDRVAHEVVATSVEEG